MYIYIYIYTYIYILYLHHLGVFHGLLSTVLLWVFFCSICGLLPSIALPPLTTFNYQFWGIFLHYSWCILIHWAPSIGYFQYYFPSVAASTYIVFIPFGYITWTAFHCPFVAMFLQYLWCPVIHWNSSIDHFQLPILGLFSALFIMFSHPLSSFH